MCQTNKAGHSSVIGYGFHSHSFLNEGTSHDLGEHVSATSTHQCSRIARDGIAGKAARRERCRNRPGIVTCPAARHADFKRDKARICRRFSRRSALTSARREESTSRIARAARYTLISSSLFDLGSCKHWGFGSGGRGGRGVAQVGPIDVGAQVFAADGAIGGALDGWALVRRNVSPGKPVMNNLRHHAEQFCQTTLPADLRDCFNKSFHATENKHVGNLCQHVVFA